MVSRFLCSGEHQLSTLFTRNFHKLARYMPPIAQSGTLHSKPDAGDWLLIDRKQALLLSVDHGMLSTRKLGDFSTIGDSALSPDGALLAFSVIKSSQNFAILWSVHQNKILSQTPLSAPALHPLIDNRSQAVFFIDQNGNGLRFSAQPLDTPQSFQTLTNPSNFALGWLETRLLVIAGDQAELLDSHSLKTLKTLSLPAPANSLFITGDGKQALIGLANSDQLLRIELRDGHLHTISLPETITPTAVFMGSSNTLCH